MAAAVPGSGAACIVAAHARPGRSRGRSGPRAGTAPWVAVRCFALAAHSMQHRRRARCRSAVAARARAGACRVVQAPLPTESLSTEERRQAVLDEVIRQQRGAHGTVAMPAWQSNPEIKPHILDLYAYLKARSDGVLGAGQPKVLGAK